MKIVIPVVLFLIMAGGINAPLFHNESHALDPDWPLHARISTPYGYNLSWEEGLDRAVKNGANVILDWANFSDTYQGRILHFNDSLEEFRQRAEYVHSHYPGIKYMVYFGPLEMGTYDSDMNKDGKDDDGKGSTYTDHPDWLQVGIDGRKAVFYGSMPGMPFWVGETDEDTWLSPSNKEYRSIIMDEARRITEAGADAIWFDVPHLCFDFGDGWQNQWSSVDEASRTAFHNDTGLILPEPPIQPDWGNETWLKFVEWRYKQISDFVSDFSKAMKEGNSDSKLVIETYSQGLFITRFGCDVSEIPEVCDVIGHEYGGPFYKLQRYSWLEMLATMKYWHDFDTTAGKNASWILSYVQHGDVELANFHAALLSTMGFNYYTSGGEGMAELVDEQFMHNFFDWLGNRDEYFYGWNSDADVAVVFSRHTLDYLDKGNWEGYAYHDGFLGAIMMLIESNIPFKVITENDMDTLSRYNAVIIPDFACMSEEQAEKIRQYVSSGGTIISINETSLYNEYGAKRQDFALKNVFGVGVNEAEDESVYVNNYGNGKSIFIVTPIGRYYYWAAQPWANYSDKNEAEYWRGKMIEMLGEANINIPFEITGDAVAIPYEKGNEKMIRILNMKGIRYGNAAPQEQEVEVTIHGDASNVTLLDFMGGWRNPNLRKEGNDTVVSFTLYNQSCLMYSVNSSNLYASLVAPEKGKIYFMDREIMTIGENRTVAIGGITVKANTNGNRVEFYVDDELKYEDSEEPYQWFWNEFSMGNHEIKVVAYDGGNKASDELEILKLL